MGKFGLNFAALLLIAATAFGASGLHWCFAPKAISAGLVETCPDHHRQPQAPEPASHQCCAAGHRPAALPSAYHIVSQSLLSAPGGLTTPLMQPQEAVAVPPPQSTSKVSFDHIPLRV